MGAYAICQVIRARFRQGGGREEDNEWARQPEPEFETQFDEGEPSQGRRCHIVRPSSHLELADDPTIAPTKSIPGVEIISTLTSIRADARLNRERWNRGIQLMILKLISSYFGEQLGRPRISIGPACQEALPFQEGLTE